MLLQACKTISNGVLLQACKTISNGVLLQACKTISNGVLLQACKTISNGVLLQACKTISNGVLLQACKTISNGVLLQACKTISNGVMLPLLVMIICLSSAAVALMDDKCKIIELHEDSMENATSMFTDRAIYVLLAMESKYVVTTNTHDCRLHTPASGPWLDTAYCTQRF